MNKHFRRGMLILLWSMALAMAAACHRTPDEERVRQAVVTAGRAAEKTDASALGEVLDEQFDGNAGQVARKDLQDMLRLARLRHETIHVLVGPVDIQARGDRYVAMFTVTLTSGGQTLPAQMGLYQVQSAWRKDGGRWICYSATWKH
ncbi:hypothetical protein [Dyella sp.]|uniref:hypothetical protein n=1 Tax=Dyella sp. TaxID=1869338 RepID=UPI002ED61A22